MDTKARFLEYTGKVFRDEHNNLVEGDLYRGDTILRFQNGMLDGRGENAIECSDGHMEWWSQGRLHRARTEGPAVTTIAQESYKEYWENGDRVG